MHTYEQVNSQGMCESCLAAEVVDARGRKLPNGVTKAEGV